MNDYTPVYNPLDVAVLGDFGYEVVLDSLGEVNVVVQWPDGTQRHCVIDVDAKTMKAFSPRKKLHLDEREPVTVLWFSGLTRATRRSIEEHRELEQLRTRVAELKQEAGAR